MNYVHGYSPREAERLDEQAAVLRELLHGDVAYAPGTRVLEPGCGTGAQTVELLRRSPGIRLTAVDASAASLEAARARIGAAGLEEATFLHGPLAEVPLGDGRFDAAFVCFLLEHLYAPLRCLRRIRDALRPGGTVTVTEGDHGACVFHPETPEAVRVWSALPDCQAEMGGDGRIGRRLFQLLTEAGFADVRVEPRVVYCDPGRPEVREGFVRRTIIPMVETVRAQALADGMMDRAVWARGIADLTQVAEEGTFVYTFFRATARTPE